MLTRRHFLATWMGYGAALTAGYSTFGQAQSVSLRLAVVVAKTSPLQDLSIHDLKHLYMGDQIIGPGGKKFVPVALRAGSPERVAFERAVLGMAPERVASYWIDRKIRGQSGPPTTVDSAEVLQRAVSKIDGGIGYLRARDVRDFVKVVRIDGKGPEDPGYGVEY